MEVIDSYVRPSRKKTKDDSDSDLEVNNLDFDKFKAKFQKYCQDELDDQRAKYNKELKSRENEIKECKATLSRLQKEKEVAEKELKKELEKNKENYERLMAEMEKHYEGKLDILKDKIKSMENNDDFKPLTEAIFNCITIEEIFEIKKLVRNREFEDLVDNHLDTLQKLFLSLSYGVIPICQPQRDVISETQSKLIANIETSSPSKAKTLIMQNRSDIIDIFNTIEQSIELAANSYDKFRR